MSYREPARTAGPRTRSPILGSLAVASAALLAVLVYESPASSPFATGSPVDMLGDGTTAEERRRPALPLGQEDGAVPNGVTVFDDDHPAVANLDRALLRALRQAATDAAVDGVDFYVESGWRSPQYQERLLQEAVVKYGSAREAARWVATPDRSAHVSGDAVDIGHSDATEWLSEHGAEYGLCQIYRNEPWHYELRPKAVNLRCPPMFVDPAHDPRMQR